MSNVSCMKCGEPDSPHCVGHLCLFCIQKGEYCCEEMQFDGPNFGITRDEVGLFFIENRVSKSQRNIVACPFCRAQI